MHLSKIGEAMDMIFENKDDYAVEIENLTVSYGIKPVLMDIDLKIPKGKLVAVIGPNGAGKTTLLKSVLGLIKPVKGKIKFGYERGIRKSAYVPQSSSVDWDFPTTALDVVLMGRYGKIGWFKRPGKKDIELSKELLNKVGMGEYAGRQISQLSGGQQQRVFLARALAQEAEIYFMDEPFKGVDAQTEKVIVGLFKEIKSEGKTVVSVHHDLRTVEEYFDYAVFINERLIAGGPVGSVFNDKNIEKTYRIKEVTLKEVV